MPFDDLGGLGPWLERWYRRLRYSAGMELELDWWTIPLSYTDDTHRTLWRAVAVKVVSWTDEEFVMAKGVIEARISYLEHWTKLASLRRHLELPIEIPPNRAWSNKIPGEAFADLLEDKLDPDGPVQLRIQAEDHYGRTLESNSLEVTIEELRRETTARI